MTPLFHNLNPTMRRFLSLISLLILIIGVIFLVKQNQETTTPPEPADITSFQECIDAGYPAMESYPRQCRVPDGATFTENIGNLLEKADLIQLDAPRPNAVVTSPLEVSGQARGSWFFEATFPVVLTDWDGLIIAEGFATADGDWMTSEFVPFTATLEFQTPEYGERGSLILQKSNASGLPENDDALEIPILFRQNNS